MNAFQIILIVLAGLIFFGYIKKFIQTRGIQNYSVSDTYNKTQNSRSVILLDVRTLQERKANMIKGSYHIPLHELGTRMNELNKFKDKEIICYCRTGNRSLSAASKLKRNGFNSANLRGGINSWFANGLK